MKICVVSPNRNAYSETFIKAHIERLEEVVDVFYGGYLPTHSERLGGPILSTSLWSRARRAFSMRVMGRSLTHLQQNAIKKRLTQLRVNVVLAEFGPTGVAMLPVCMEMNVPLVTHFHGLDAYHEGVLGKYGTAYGRLFEHACLIVAVSRHMEKQLLGLGASAQKLVYNCYGVDPKRFIGGDPAKSNALFVGVGRFTEKKAPYLTIMAFQKVLSEIPEAKLTIIGDGVLLDPCRKLISALNLESAVSLPGVLAPAEVAQHLRQARAFVQHSLTPSNNDHEGTPLAVLEACATGVPVISTYHAGIPDVIEHELNGLLSAENDIDSMARNMIRLARDPKEAGRMGDEGRKVAKDKFSVTRSMATLQKILEQVDQNR